MFRLLLFLSRITKNNSIISSTVLSNCINTLSLSLFSTWCDMLCKNSVKACLDISALLPKYIFSAANALIETNPHTFALLNFSWNWFAEIFVSFYKIWYFWYFWLVFIKYGKPSMLLGKVTKSIYDVIIRKFIAFA